MEDIGDLPELDVDLTDSQIVRPDASSITNSNGIVPPTLPAVVPPANAASGPLPATKTMGVATEKSNGAVGAVGADTWVKAGGSAAGAGDDEDVLSNVLELDASLYVQIDEAKRSGGTSADGLSGREGVDLVVYAGDFVEGREEWIRRLSSSLSISSCCFAGEFAQNHAQLAPMSVKVMTGCNTWSRTVLRTLQRLTNEKSQKKRTIMISAGAPIPTLYDIYMEGAANGDKFILPHQWASIDQINTDGSSGLSFKSYYLALMWRPLPPSGRVPRLTHRIISVLPAALAARAIPPAFFTKGLDLEKAPETFFDHLIPSVLSDQIPTIRA